MRQVEHISGQGDRYTLTRSSFNEENSESQTWEAFTRNGTLYHLPRHAYRLVPEAAWKTVHVSISICDESRWLALDEPRIERGIRKFASLPKGYRWVYGLGGGLKIEHLHV